MNTAAAGDHVVIEHTLNAPIEAVWKAWTDGDAFKAWYGPSSMRIPDAELDAQVGGRRRVSMAPLEGTVILYFGGEFVEVDEPNRLVYTDHMADERGNPIPPSAMGMEGDEPQITRVVVDLAPVEGGGTQMTLTHEGVPANSPGASGWVEAVNKLDDYLRSSSSGVSG